MDSIRAANNKLKKVEPNTAEPTSQNSRVFAGASANVAAHLKGMRKVVAAESDEGSDESDDWGPCASQPDWQRGVARAARTLYVTYEDAPDVRPRLHVLLGLAAAAEREAALLEWFQERDRSEWSKELWEALLQYELFTPQYFRTGSCSVYPLPYRAEQPPKRGLQLLYSSPAKLAEAIAGSYLPASASLQCVPDAATLSTLPRRAQTFANLLARAEYVPLPFGGSRPANFLFTDAFAAAEKSLFESLACNEARVLSARRGFAEFQASEVADRAAGSSLPNFFAAKESVFAEPLEDLRTLSSKLSGAPADRVREDWILAHTAAHHYDEVYMSELAAVHFDETGELFFGEFCGVAGVCPLLRAYFRELRTESPPDRRQLLGAILVYLSVGGVSPREFPAARAWTYFQTHYRNVFRDRIPDLFDSKGEWRAPQSALLDFKPALFQSGLQPEPVAKIAQHVQSSPGLRATVTRSPATVEIQRVMEGVARALACDARAPDSVPYDSERERFLEHALHILQENSPQRKELAELLAERSAPAYYTQGNVAKARAAPT